VNPLVDPDERVLILVIQPGVRALDLLQQRAGHRAGGLVHPARVQLGGVALELRAALGNVDDVRGVDVRHERAPPRLHGDEVLERQPLHRLAQRCPPDAEFGHQRVLAQDCPRRQAQGEMRSRSSRWARSAIRSSGAGPGCD
jgi:hypothetical protein